MTPMDLRLLAAEGAARDRQVDGVAWDRMPLGAPRAAARSALDFAANRDGRWAPTWEAFQLELAELTDLLDELVAAGADRPAAQFSDREQFVQGVKMAASWTLGTEALPPLSGRTPMPVSDAAVGDMIAIADRVIAGQSEIRWYVEGVRAWLRWITGAQPAIVYPD